MNNIDLKESEILKLKNIPTGNKERLIISKKSQNLTIIFSIFIFCIAISFLIIKFKVSNNYKATLLE